MSGQAEFSTAPGPTLEQLQNIKRSREALLIRKWTGGQALSREEMSEIAHILPPGLLAQPPEPRARYLHDYAHYAAALGYDVRNIKRLVSVGKKARLLPPLDAPAQFPEWWERMRHLGHLKQQVPQRLVDAASKALAAAPATPPIVPVEDKSAPSQNSSTPPPAAGAPPPPPTAPPTTRIDFASIEAIGLEGAVRELQLQLSAAQIELRKAREAGLEEITITRRQKAFDATLDSLRKSEKALQDLQIARGDLAPVADFRRDLITIATTLRGMLRRRADNICAALADTLTSEQLGLVRAAIEAEGQREQTLLRSARHWKTPADGRDS